MSRHAGGTVTHALHTTVLPAISLCCSKCPFGKGLFPGVAISSALHDATILKAKLDDVPLY